MCLAISEKFKVVLDWDSNFEGDFKLLSLR